MLRKMLLIAAAVAMPVGIVTATAGTAGAAKTPDATGAPATASCSLSGGTISFKVPIGIVTPGGQVQNAGTSARVEAIARNTNGVRGVTNRGTRGQTSMNR